MNLFRLYYTVKPLIPRKVRWILRRVHAHRINKVAAGEWPIKPGSEKPPAGWPGWPEGKKFAFVLTHDIESQKGLDKVRELAEVEMELGFRSSFNFIPEGEYRVPKELRDWLVDNGFEVGIHGLVHDGKLYSSRSIFEKRAKKINGYIKEWNATGFRSPLMHRNLEWLHQMDITYDSSTFDTDPFEPQPDGCDTIFPFLVSKEGSGKSNTYIEIPYTLPQDSTLFLLLREKSPAIWKEKLDWLAERGGMALSNIHPDYIQFDGEANSWDTYPVEFVREFLTEVKTTYKDEYWHPLPRELAGFMDSVYQKNERG